mmetsp:Transcript_2982/g.7489  ORF Transcript_2982/g.7489 Transcript_2982/m.7489 type:complete len:355 (+) Transcript_2982:63-1127(+)
MFSATWDDKGRALGRALLRDGAIHLRVGSANLAVNTSVEQRFEVMTGEMRKGAHRVRRLCAVLAEFLGAPKAQAVSDNDNDSDDDTSDEKNDEESHPTVTDEIEIADAYEADATHVIALDATDASPRVILFVEHKQEAKALARVLEARGFAATPLHGDMSQTARVLSMAKFRAGSARVLVATDVAARGLDVRGVSHVINFSLGGSVETYVHRVGRCGRAGAKGVALSFVVDGDEFLAGELTTMLGRQRVRVPVELAELGRAAQAKAAKLAARAAAAAGSGGGRGAGRGGRGQPGRGGGARGADEEDDEEDEEQEARQVNREKQLKMQQQKDAKGRAQQKPSKAAQTRGGRGGRR